ncbi:hypothetical protein V7S43_003711 [Phytophthora oleae]|uniref:Uncharacterized protein n=1 Tax=Phytophthora oleae TaxID=2107226 RepID=A0ABD3FYD9_9STRA
MLGDVKTRLNARYHKNYVHENALCDGCGMSPIVGGKWSATRAMTLNCATAVILQVSMALRSATSSVAVWSNSQYRSIIYLVSIWSSLNCSVVISATTMRRVVKWLCAIVSGARSQKIYNKMIVKSGLHPDIRARLVAQLGALASERADISLKTEWFAEKTLEEEAADSDDNEGSDLLEFRPVELDGDKLSPTKAFTPPNVRLETLRMYLMDAPSSKSGNEAETPTALSTPQLKSTPMLRSPRPYDEP